MCSMTHSIAAAHLVAPVDQAVQHLLVVQQQQQLRSSDVHRALIHRTHLRHSHSRAAVNRLPVQGSILQAANR